MQISPNRHTETETRSSSQLPWLRQSIETIGAQSAAEAIAAAGLDFEVQKQPLYTGYDRNIRVPDRFVTCRTDRLEAADGGILGIVGKHYQPLQNRDAFGVVNALVQNGDATLERVGNIRNGRQIWLLARLKGEMVVTDEDVSRPYLLMTNSHDGSTAVRIGLTAVRVICQNTLQLALRSMRGVSIRHHADVEAEVQAARDLLGLAHQAFDEAADAMRQLTRISMPANRLDEFVSTLLPKPEHDDQSERIAKQRNRIKELFETGDGNSLHGVRGSAWAAVNAVTQFVDRESYTTRNKEPLRSIWFGEGAKLKAEAWRLASQSLIDN